MVVGKFKTHPEAKNVGKGKGRQPAPEVKQEDLEDKLVAYVNKNGANTAFDFEISKKTKLISKYRNLNFFECAQFCLQIDISRKFLRTDG